MGGCAWQGALCGQRLGAKVLEIESAECKDVQADRWVGLGEPRWGRRCRKDVRSQGAGLGPERVFPIGIGHLGSIPGENIAAQS